MFCSAQHDRGGRRFNALTFATNHSGFSTSVKSTRFPFAMLKPLVEKNFQFCGWFANSVPATGVGRMTKCGPGALAEPRFRFIFHFGPVAIGGVASLGEESLMGIEVNFAFRLEKLASSRCE